MTNFSYETEGRNVQATSWDGLTEQDWGIWEDSQWRGCYAYVMGAPAAVATEAKNVAQIGIIIEASLNLHCHSIASGVLVIGGTASYTVIVLITIAFKTNRAYSYRDRLSIMPLSGFKLTGIPPPTYGRAIA